MDNQHQKIKGYRDLSQGEIDAMNAVKEKAAEVGKLIEDLSMVGTIGGRWLAEAKTDLQKGFMSAVRAIAQPTSF